MYFYMCARRDALVIFFLTNDLFLSVESFFKIKYYINRNSNITKYHDNNNYFIYYDNNIYILIILILIVKIKILLLHDRHRKE